MSFIDEVLSVFGGENAAPVPRVMLFGWQAVYVEGVKVVN